METWSLAGKSTSCIEYPMHQVIFRTRFISVWVVSTRRVIFLFNMVMINLDNRYCTKLLFLDFISGYIYTDNHQQPVYILQLPLTANYYTCQTESKCRNIVTLLGINLWLLLQRFQSIWLRENVNILFWCRRTFTFKIEFHRLVCNSLTQSAVHC